ncbi:NADH dehydrogenase [ubiquinone] 1 beta subcomplex subunit 11, mitochondrial [Leptidea sinapis]|nr:NADH dehydrogenase [ubiquinone] 1 beta subcomplex subunit 11, mitochondrial [Leptidea sinapis]
MASLIKFRNMTVIQKSVWNHLMKVNRTITTSKKNSDTATVAPSANTSTENKNWVSYGFDYKDQQEDTNVHHASYFFSITLCLVFGGFAWAYAPDVHMRDWAQREAYLELYRREKAGLPVIDPNYVNPKTMKLPSDSSLGECEIII